MTWLTLGYGFATAILGFFSGYYFVISFLLKKQVLELNRQLKSTYELINFMDHLGQEESLDTED